MYNRLHTYYRMGLPTIALVAAFSGVLQWLFAPTVADHTAGDSTNVTITKKPPCTLSLQHGSTGHVTMCAPGREDVVAATESIGVGGVDVHLEGLHYCCIRGSLDHWIVDRSYVSGGLLVFTWGERGERKYTASLRHLGSRCVELLTPGVPPNELLERLADRIDEPAAVAPQGIHQLLQNLYQCKPNSDRIEAGTSLTLAVAALCMDHWRPHARGEVAISERTDQRPVNAFYAMAMEDTFDSEETSGL